HRGRRAERRHAAHLRRHFARARGSRVRAGCRARSRTRGGVSVVVKESVMARRRLGQVAAVAALATATMAAAGCGVKTRGAVPPGTSEPDRFLFEKGSEALNNKKWLTAR